MLWRTNNRSQFEAISLKIRLRCVSATCTGCASRPNTTSLFITISVKNKPHSFGACLPSLHFALTLWILFNSILFGTQTAHHTRTYIYVEIYEKLFGIGVTQNHMHDSVDYAIRTSPTWECVYLYVCALCGVVSCIVHVSAFDKNWKAIHWMPEWKFIYGFSFPSPMDLPAPCESDEMKIARKNRGKRQGILPRARAERREACFRAGRQTNTGENENVRSIIFLCYISNRILTY